MAFDLGLEGAGVLVTGGGSGIGAAVVKAVADVGAIPMVLDRDGAAAAAVAARVPGGLAITADVTDEDQVTTAVEQATRDTGLDVVINCAGVAGPVGTPLQQTTLDQWQQVFAVNVTGTFLVLKHALPALAESPRGAAVLIASDSALVAAPGMVPYCASKAAVVQLARALAVEAAGQVRVTALCPSVVDTPMSRHDLGDDGIDNADFPVHSPAQIAKQAVFLASPAATGIDGTAVVADFGYSARSAFPA